MRLQWILILLFSMTSIPDAFSTVLTVVDSGHGPNLPENFSKNLSYDLKCKSDIAEENHYYARGHGTHVFGLASQNCSECSVSMVKIFGGPCPKNPNLYPEGIIHAIASGAEVISMSAGRQYHNDCDDTNVGGDYKRIMCEAIEVAKLREVLFVAASGNSFQGKGRNKVDFPANHADVIASGGSSEIQNHFSVCDQVSSGTLCESNYGLEVEFHARAESVLSDSYPDWDWAPNKNHPELGCGDSTHDELGKGLCTGTSMSSPVVAAKLARARHLFPLKGLTNLKNELHEYTSRTDHLGFGVVDINRVQQWITFNPLFSVVNFSTGETFYTTGPRMAMAKIDMDGFVPIGEKTTTKYPLYNFGKSLNKNSFLEDMSPQEAKFDFYVVNIISDEAKEHYRFDIIKIYRFGNRAGVFPIGTEKEIELAKEYDFSPDEYLGYLLLESSPIVKNDKNNLFVKICRVVINGKFSISSNCKGAAPLGYALKTPLDPIDFTANN